MFKNIGGKIKWLAETVCLLGIVISVLSGIYLIAADETLAGVLVMLLGSFASWIGSFFTYGFGQLIENSDILVEQGKQKGNAPIASSEKKTAPIAPAEKKEENNKTHTWRCSRCGNLITSEPCPHCNAKP